MKLIIAIVQDEDAARLVSNLMNEGYSVTKLATTGGFLRAGNTTLLLGVDEEKFLATLDEMSEQAFDDQCTGANPRYPLISEIKEMYLKAYYGE